MKYKITMRDVERIIWDAFMCGSRYGEMRVMGSEGYDKYKEDAFRTVLSNSKTLLLDTANRDEENGFDPLGEWSA